MKYPIATLLATLSLASAKIGKPARRKLDGDCTRRELDFNSFSRGHELKPSDLDGWGLAIRVEHDGGCIGPNPYIFDTQNPTCSDEDLQGSSADGMAVFIQEDNSPSGNGVVSELSCLPDDCAAGGRIYFEWNEPVKLEDVTLRIMDMDERVQVQVKLHGNMNYTPLDDPERPGDGVHVDYPIDMDNVEALKLIFDGSGAVPFIKWTDCPRGGNVWGDPHFQTWSGDGFDYHGACDMKLLESKQFGNDKGLEVHVRATQEDWWSYISEVAVRIGEDVLEIGKKGKHILNGVKEADLANGLSGYEVKHYINYKGRQRSMEFVYDVMLNENERIHIRSYKGVLYVGFPAGVYHELTDTIGLMGDWTYGDMLARDGKTVIEDPEVYGAEWQVRDTEAKLFQEARYPQYPEVCVPAPVVSQGRRLKESKVSRALAEEACSDWHRNKEQCIFDVMASGDLDFAG